MPTSGSTTPVAPLGVTRAVTALSASVISVTCAVFGVVWVILPARPSRRDHRVVDAEPSLEPLSIVTVEYQTVGERPITLAVTGSLPSGTIPPLVSSLSAVSSFASCCWVCCPRQLVAKSRDLVLELRALSPRASKVSPNQLTRSRAGFSARSAPDSIGLKTVATTSWTPWSGPPLPSR